MSENANARKADRVAYLRTTESAGGTVQRLLMMLAEAGSLACR